MASALLWTPALMAQTASTPLPSSATATEETIVLSPFEVTGTTDTGYQASETLAGNRLRTSIRDVGSSLSVYTSKFLQDTASLNARDLLVYTTSGEVGGIGGNFSATKNTGSFFDDTGGGSYVKPGGDTRLRGLSSADVTRDFFLSDIPFDAYNTDRVDIQRGANSILFGLASPGGVINYGLNQANFKNAGSVSIRTDQYGTLRVSGDYNAVIIPRQLAIRVDVLDNNTKYERHEAWTHDKRFYGSARYEPSFLNNSKLTTSLKVSYERGTIDGADPAVIPPRDQFSYWFTTAQKAVNNPYAVLNATNGTASGYTNAALGYNNAGRYLTDASGNVLPASFMSLIIAGDGAAGRWREDIGAVWLNPDSSLQGGGGVYAWMQRQAVADRPGETGGPYGQFVGLRTYAAMMGQITNQAGFWKDRSISDPSIFDFYHHILGGPNRFNGQDFNVFNASVNQTFLDNQFGYELTYDRQSVDGKQLNAFAWEDGGAINIDINKTLSDGTPNPNFGRPFVGSDYVDNYVDNRDRQARRATGFYDLDFNKKLSNSTLGSMLGRHTFTLLWTNQSDDHKTLRYSRSAVDTGYLQLINRTGQVFNWENPSGLHYVGNSLATASSAANAGIAPITAMQVPTSGYSGLVYNPNTHAWINRAIDVINDDANYSTFSPSWQKQSVESEAAVWQGHILDDVIVPTIGWRKDTAKVYQSNTSPINPVTGYNIVDDGSRWYLAKTPTRKITGRNTSYSVVAHTPRFVRSKLPLGMDIDLSFNKSQNFSPSAGGVDIYGAPLPAQTGSTKDYGITVSFFENKLSFRAIKFEAAAQNAPSSDVNTFFLVQDEVNFWNAAHDPYNILHHPDAVAAYSSNMVPASLMSVWNWKVTTDPVTGRQVATATRPPGIGDIADTTSKGYEFEVMAHPIRGLDISFNASKTEAGLANNLKDLTTFMNDRIAVWTGVAGTMVGNGDLSTTTLADDTRANLIIPYQTGLARNGFAQQELRKWRWNLVANYTFTQGAIKGLFVGGGVRWQDKAAIGYATKGAVATKDLAYDLLKPYFGPAETNYDLWAGYEFNLRKGLKWKVQLNARNLFQNDGLIPIGAEPDGSISTYRIAPETLYTLTNTLSF